MQRKSQSIELQPKEVKDHFTSIPFRVKGHIFSFFGVESIPALTRVAKDWKISDSTLKTMICHEIKISPEQLKNAPQDIDEWKNAYHKFRQYHATQKKLDEVKIEVAEDAADIEQMNDMMQMAIRSGVQAAPIIVRKDTCLSGILGGGVCSGATALVSLFACKDVLGIFACWGFLTGCLGGCMGRTWWVSKRNENARRKQTLLSEQLNNMQEPLLIQVEDNKEELDSMFRMV